MSQQGGETEVTFYCLIGCFQFGASVPSTPNIYQVERFKHTHCVQRAQAYLEGYKTHTACWNWTGLGQVIAWMGGCLRAPRWLHLCSLGDWQYIQVTKVNRGWMGNFSCVKPTRKAHKAQLYACGTPIHLESSCSVAYIGLDLPEGISNPWKGQQQHSSEWTTLGL